jgi:predicted DsbA family dithiol-disulfide isomerase
LYDVLNRKHFTEQGILNDMTLLLEAAGEVGCDVHACRLFLESREGEEEILSTYHRVTEECGINSIPTLIVDGGKYVISGAVHANTIADTLRAVVKSGDINGYRAFDMKLNL